MTSLSGSKPHLLLLHGALGSSAQMNQLQVAVQDDFKIHLLNFSGHGGRDIPESGYSLDIFEQDIDNYLKSNSIPNAYIFGYSMGGYVALSYARKNPHQVNSVFTLATKFNWAPESAAKEAAMLDPVVMRQKIPQYTENLRKLHYPADWKKIVSETATFMINLGNHPMTENDFNSVSCPVICTVGDRDKMVSPEETERVAQWIPEGRSCILADTPHPLEACDLQILRKMLIEFFKKEKV